MAGPLDFALNVVKDVAFNKPILKLIGVDVEEDRKKCPKPEIINIVSIPNWCAPNAPAIADAYLAQIGGAAEGAIFRKLLGFKDIGKGVAGIPWWGCLLFGSKPGSVGQFVISVVYIIASTWDLVWSQTLGNTCFGGKGLILLVRSLFMGVLNRWTGISWGPIQRGWENTLHYACPQTQVFTSDAIAAYLHDEMTEKEAAAWCQSHGWCPTTTTAAISSARFRYSTGFVIQMYFRGCIVSDVQAKEALRKLGVLDKEEQTNLIECSRPLIGVDEAIQWYYMLRPGRAAGDLAYTMEECISDIKKHGYTDIQARRFIEASRAIIGVRHVLNPYYQGKVSWADVEARLLDSRWRKEDIDEIRPFYDFEKTKVLADHAGVPDSRQLVNEAADGLIGSSEFEGQLKYRGYGPNIIRNALEEVNERRKAAVRRAGIKSIQAQLKAGESNVGGALDALFRFGIQADEASTIIQIWDIERSVSAKPVSMSQLCEWFTNGWISWNQYQFQLSNLGYGPADIRRIIDSCDLKERQRMDKAAEKAERERQRAIDKAEKAKAAADKAAAKGTKATQRGAVSGRYIAERFPAAERLASEGLPGALQGLAEIASPPAAEGPAAKKE